MNNGNKIAQEIRAALTEAGEATGAEGLKVILKRDYFDEDAKPWEGEPSGIPTTYFTLVGVDNETRTRDSDGTLLKEVLRVITVDASVTEPKRTDTLATGYSHAMQVPDDGWMEIESVLRVAPGGVPLMYEIAVKN